MVRRSAALRAVALATGLVLAAVGCSSTTGTSSRPTSSAGGEGADEPTGRPPSQRPSSERPTATTDGDTGKSSDAGTDDDEAPVREPIWGLGVSAGGPNGVGQYERWLGREIKLVNVYLSRRGWLALEHSVAPAARMWEGRDVRLVVGVPMLPPSGATLAEGAEGAYDRHFRRVAEELVAHGHEDAVIRVGWEFDASWYAWDARRDPDSYRAFFRRIVEEMRSVEGSRFWFDWNSSGGDGTDPSSLYPGDDVVDIIGLDIYDSSSRPVTADPEARWLDHRQRPGGLDWLVSFAAERGKPISLPEWGLSTRHVDGAEPDNPDFVRRMHEFIEEHDVLYYSYFEHDNDEGSFALSSGTFPLAAETYRQLFGSSG